MEAFVLIITNELPFACGPSDGGKFDITLACPKCGTGARRIDPISVSRTSFSDGVGVSWNREVVVSPRVVENVRKSHHTVSGKFAIPAQANSEGISN